MTFKAYLPLRGDQEKRIFRRMRVMTGSTSFVFYRSMDVSHLQYPRHICMTFYTKHILVKESNLRVIRSMRTMTALAFAFFERKMHVRTFKTLLFFLMTGITQFSVRGNHTKRIRVCRWLMTGFALS